MWGMTIAYRINLQMYWFKIRLNFSVNVGILNLYNGQNMTMLFAKSIARNTLFESAAYSHGIEIVHQLMLRQ